MNRVQQAQQLLAAGFRLIPTNGKVATVEKGVFGKDHPDATWGAEHFADGEIGILCGPCPALGADHLVCLDVDGDPSAAPRLRDFLRDLPPTLSSHGGRHLFFRVSPDDAPRLQQWADVFHTKASTGAALDLKWSGGYACEQGDWDGAPDPARIVPLPVPALDTIVAARGGVDPLEISALPPDNSALVDAGLDTNQVLEDAAAWLLEAAPLPVDGTGGSTLMVVIGGLLVGFGLDATEAAELAAAFYYPRAWPGEEVDEAQLEHKIAEIERWGSTTFEPLQLALAARNTRELAAMEAELDSGDMDDGGIPPEERISEDAPPATGGLKLVSAAELARPLPPVPWLCERMALAPGRPALVVGRAGSGKTMAVQELALSVAAGVPVFGEFECRQGAVLHLDLDQGRYATARRYQQLAAGRGLDLAALPLDCSFFDFKLTAPAYGAAIVDPERVRQLRDVSRGRALVVIDSLRGVSVDMDENKSEIGAVLGALSWIVDRLEREPGVAPSFVVLHHAGKNAAPRGASAIIDRAGSLWEVDRPDGGDRAGWRQTKASELAFGHCQSFSTKSQFDMTTGGLQVIVVPDLEELDGAEGGADMAAQFTSLVSRILDAVRGWPGIGQRQLQDAVGGMRGKVQSVIDKLVLGAPECLGDQIWQYGSKSTGYHYFAASAETLILGVLQRGPAVEATLRVETKLPPQTVRDTCAHLKAQDRIWFDQSLAEPSWLIRPY